MSDFWDGFSAIATTAATLVALSLGVHEVKMRRKDEAERQKEATDRQGAQARLVVAGVEGERAVVVNHSIEPLLEVRIIRADAAYPSGAPVAVRWHECDQRIFHNVAAGQSLSLRLRSQDWGAHFGVDGIETGENDDGIAPQDATNRSVTVQFIDIAGLRWQRVGLAAPTRIIGELSEPAPNPE